MKKQDLAIIIMFIGFLFLPNVLYWFVKEKMDNVNYENRELVQKPEFSLKTIQNFATNYEEYYNDHLPFKNELRKLRSYILYYGFNTSASNRVIVGKNGWLFYNSAIAEGNNSIDDYQKVSFYTEEEMDEIKSVIKSDKDHFESENIQYYILMGPNKEIIYEDYMPASIKRNDNVPYSKTEELVNYLKNTSDINIVYPKKILMENKKIADTYYKFDTHWNDYGGYLATMELMKLIDNNFKELNISIKKEKRSGDLATMILTNYLINNEPIITDFYDNVEYTCKEIDTPDSLKECFSKNAIYDDTVFIVGDSFRNATVQYFAKLYKHSIIVHRNYYESEKGLISKYNPNIVINVVVERGSALLKLALT